MAESEETQNNDTQLVAVPTEDMAIRAVNKRYEGLSTIRAKATKGKGAWYWAHLEPILVRNPDTNDPKAVKLRCNLCEAVFSASNPSRTASEHLKRGTCPNFNSLLKHSSPSSSLPPLSSPSSQSNRKRLGSINEGLNSYHQHQFHHHHQQQQHLLLSGGKEDLGPLAMLEDSVKKIKSSKPLPPGPILSKTQIDSALGLLTDWFYESYGSVSYSSLDHPKFKAFMNQVGLPEISRQDNFMSSRLDSKYEEAKLESETKINDAEFFQLSSNGWKREEIEGMNMIKFMVNLPNGTTLFRETFFPSGAIPATYAEEIMWETITGTCNIVQKCVGIVADKYKTKALRNLELQNQWMVNLSCQLQGVGNLIKDFSKELPLFKNVISNCLKITNLFNNNSHARSILNKFLSHDSRFSVSFGIPPLLYCENLQNFSSVSAMLDNIISCSRVLQLVVMEDLYKVLVMEDSLATEVGDMIQNMGFWNDVEAINTLIKVVKDMVEEIEVERPLVGQCLPLWEDLKSKIKDWCVKFSVLHVGVVERIVEKRFKKNYHPAWSTAFILDPVYLLRDENGKYLPPFKCLTCEQEKDVDKLITRLVSREEAHKALMELMKWRSEGLDPLYAKAVQVKQLDPLTGKMKIANPQSSRLVWETILKDFTILGKIAVRLLFLHATTSCGFKCSYLSLLGQGQIQSRIGLERIQKMIFVAAHSKLKRRDFGSEEEKEAITNGGDDDHDMLNEVFVDANM
ncbi:uncharacterized protein LOC111903260 [Lactuca sativa]|uniref:DUF7963 domain-containing protein n=1 Tax=Lactuca sativa TaxID=4236 RepID=A0A9R1XS01_LACSA|nr:uncharacterized protein LOC111903260 [Lactuca sativa]KAJ0223551.1 hypothetical protein LSAT_V11C200098390 [Lactuca sativa]